MLLVALLPAWAALCEKTATWCGCGRPGLWFSVCPVSAEAAPVCGLASLLPTPPLRSRTVCSGSQACLLLLVPGNQGWSPVEHPPVASRALAFNPREQVATKWEAAQDSGIVWFLDFKYLDMCACTPPGEL